MPLIIEDGSAVQDANSYVGLEEARELALLRGITLSPNDNELTAHLINAADRITTYESHFTGYRVSGAQGLSYPRTGSYRYGSAFPFESIPKELKLAQVVMAGILEEGGELWATGTSGITREKVGPLETEYSDTAADSVGNPVLPQIDSILTPLFIPVSVNFRVGR